jgi:hypothetical protein
MKLRPTPAGVIACLALTIALGGSAFAATALVPKDSVGSAQVINGSLQTKDLSGKARKALRGSRGPRGYEGPQGNVGPTGPKGPAGSPWTLGNGVLPSGKTLRGVFAPGGTAAAPDDAVQESVSFGFISAGFPTVHYVPNGTTPPPECPGSKTQPEAAPGHLCLYEAQVGNVSATCVFNPVTNACGEASGRGFGVAITAATSGDFWLQGSWAVTAP